MRREEQDENVREDKVVVKHLECGVFEQKVEAPAQNLERFAQFACGTAIVGTDNAFAETVQSSG